MAAHGRRKKKDHPPELGGTAGGPGQLGGSTPMSWIQDLIARRSRKHNGPVDQEERISAGPGYVRVAMRVPGFVPTEAEPNSRPGVFDEAVSPADACSWARLLGSGEMAAALMAAAALAEELRGDETCREVVADERAAALRL